MILKVDHSAGEKKFPAATGIFDMGGHRLAVQLYLRDETVGAGQKAAGYNVRINHMGPPNRELLRGTCRPGNKKDIFFCPKLW